MGLLDQLWDDTVAGPPPLGKLRKYNSFSPSYSSSSSSAAAAAAAAAAVVDGQVSRSITILRSTPSSPRSSCSSLASPPSSPFASPGPRGDWKRLRRKPVPPTEGMETAEPRSPTVYD